MANRAITKFDISSQFMLIRSKLPWAGKLACYEAGMLKTPMLRSFKPPGRQASQPEASLEAGIESKWR
jgi:hypothetical protein